MPLEMVGEFRRVGCRNSCALLYGVTGIGQGVPQEAKHPLGQVTWGEDIVGILVYCKVLADL